MRYRIEMEANINIFFIAVGLITFLVSGCRSSAEDVGRINYEELNEIEAEIVMEIGKGDDYLPGRLRDLVLTSDRTMLVSDLGKTTIEQFNAKGEHMGTIATEGRGPGELSSFFSLFDGGNDTLIVRHGGMSQQVDYFGKGTDGIFRHVRSWVREQFSERYVTIIGARSESEYYARASLNSQDVQQWIANLSDHNRTPVVIVDEFENILQDSLHLLKAPKPLVEAAGARGMTVLGMPPYQYRDRFRLMEDGHYLIARPDSSALFIYNSDHGLDKRIHLNVIARPVESADLDHEFELMNASSETRKKMKARVPNIKPPFLNIWLSQHRIWMHTDNNEAGKQIVVFTMEGDPMGIFYLSEFDDIRYFRNDRIHTLHKNPDTGHSIRIYQVEL